MTCLVKEHVDNLPLLEKNVSQLQIEDIVGKDTGHQPKHHLRRLSNIYSISGVSYTWFWHGYLGSGEG